MAKEYESTLAQQRDRRDVPITEEAVEAPRANSLWTDAWRRLKQDRAAILGAIISICLLLVAVFAPWLAPFDPNYQNIAEGLSDIGAPVGPNSTFWLGTDYLGRDLLSRLIYGARVSMLVGIVGNGLAVLIAVLLGATAAYAGGWVELVIMRFTDVMMAFPILLLAIALSTILRPGVDILILIIAVLYWVYLARIIHGRVLSIKEEDYVMAARAIGAGHRRIVVRHIFPHLVSEAVVYATLGVASTILTEAQLSYLGLGIQPPTASWGNMIAEGQSYFRNAPWLIIFPGLMLMFTVLGFNLMGDGLRDALDPQQRRGR